MQVLVVVKASQAWGMIPSVKDDGEAPVFSGLPQFLDHLTMFQVGGERWMTTNCFL